MKWIEVIERLWVPVFGFSLLIIVALLARGIAINDIQQNKSYGLEPLLIILATLGTKWADYAFRIGRNAPSVPPPALADKAE